MPNTLSLANSSYVARIMSNPGTVFWSLQGHGTPGHRTPSLRTRLMYQSRTVKHRAIRWKNPLHLEEMAGQDPKFQKEAADQNFDYMFKLLIIGNSSVGKTSFLFRYADDSFTSAFVSTVGIDFKVKTVFRHDKRVKLQIWVSIAPPNSSDFNSRRNLTEIASLQDTAGQERYRTITTAYYRGAMGFILMYDITNEESFNSVQDWVTQIKTYSCDNAQVILVGNKCDMEDERVITTERGKQLADQLGVQFFETSAKENINIKVNPEPNGCSQQTPRKFEKCVTVWKLDTRSKLELTKSRQLNPSFTSNSQTVFEQLVDIICDKMSESLDNDPTLIAGGMGQAKGQRLTDQPTNPTDDNSSIIKVTRNAKIGQRPDPRPVKITLIPSRMCDGFCKVLLATPKTNITFHFVAVALTINRQTEANLLKPENRTFQKLSRRLNLAATMGSGTILPNTFGSSCILNNVARTNKGEENSTSKEGGEETCPSALQGVYFKLNDTLCNILCVENKTYTNNSELTSFDKSFNRKSFHNITMEIN
ncbi:Ras-related protein Rab-3 [Melipona quadrifasciata]|uniref:Ras-related protein Rab-3 n=1 Tax=Melipona quadrifasciata TaxID=166423 RepID=A0A0M8ZY00_9HYME|nr:Ras-related protein Rab-3 [Melipona quadrifasciata]